METKSRPRDQTRQELVSNIKADIQVWKDQVDDETLPQHVRDNARQELERVKHCSTKKIQARQNGEATA